MKLVETTNVGDIAGVIKSGNISIMRGFSTPDTCQSCINEATGIGPSLVDNAMYERGVSFLSTYDGGSNIGYYRFYSGPDISLENLRLVYERMRNISKMVRLDIGCTNEVGGPQEYHLELLRYSKGDFFRRHSHELEPQLVGLICLLSCHYDGQSGTIFYSGNDTIDTAGTMMQGDLVIFPWDTEHEVARIDGPDRWVALLPYY